MRCPRGHEGAVALFTSVSCGVCERGYDQSSVVIYFAFVVDQFHAKHGGKPLQARIPRGWRAPLSAWEVPSDRYRWIELLDGKDGEVVLTARAAGKLVSERYAW